MKTVLNFFDTERDAMLVQADHLHAALIRFRCESSTRREKNMRSVRQAVLRIESMMKKHQKVQEKIIFPFLLAHIPRHEAAIHYLEAEHEDLEEKEMELKKSFRNISNRKGALMDAKIYERGICLVALLRHHLGFEGRSLRKSLHAELKKDEKRTVASRFTKCFKGVRR